MQNHHCPRCQQEIDEARMKLVPAICGSCGFVLSTITNQAGERKTEKSNTRMLWALGALSIFTFFQLMSWGTYAPEVRMLQLRDLTGTASVQSMERLSVICTELKKYDCIEYAYSRQAQLDKRNTRRFAEYLIKRHKFKEAARALGTYLQTAKTDTGAMALYAKVLGDLGHTNDAITTYERTIAAQSRILQPEVVQAYVRTLARAKRYTQAQAVILRMRRLHARSPRFMEQELRIVSELNTGREVASKK